MVGKPETFEAFVQQRVEVAAAYVRGDDEPLAGIVAHRSLATFFGPMGGTVEDARTVGTCCQKDAAAFGPDGESKLDILHSAASGSLGYWVGRQRARAFMDGSKTPTPMTMRITEMFRHDDEWKLIHRHAHMLAEAKSRPNS